MSLSNTEIRYLNDKTGYMPYPYGRNAGEPTVQLVLSKSDTNIHKLGNLDKSMSRYGWKRKLKSGFARLRVKGSRPLDDMHIEALSALNDIADPRFIDIELRGNDINREPSRITDTFTDSYSLFIDPQKEKYEEDALQFFVDRSRNFGDCEFIFKVKSFTDEDRVEDISRRFKMYDSDVYLYPVGNKMHTVAENTEKCVEMAKRNTWNISPRFDIVREYHEEYQEQEDDE